MPFVMLAAFVLIWGLPSIKNAMNQATTPAFERGGWDMPALHLAVTRAEPVVSKPEPEKAKFDFNWLTATGSACFIAAIISGLFLGVVPSQLLRIFWRTLVRMRFAVLAISFMLGLGFVTRYSGMDAVLGLAFTRTGWLFPFFGTFLGWLAGLAVVVALTLAARPESLSDDPVIYAAFGAFALATLGAVVGRTWAASRVRSL